MFEFLKKSTDVRTGVLVDIGSGSVGVAIVKSELTKESPEIIWSYREYIQIKDIEDTKETLKLINTAIVNAFLELGSIGTKVMRDSDPTLKITDVQAAISAPWSYTVTKSITYSGEHPFDIDENTVESLVTTAKKQIKTSLKESGLAAQGLELINDDTINASINGYNLSYLTDQKGRDLTLTHLNALAHGAILKTLKESVEKVFPKANLTIDSFMYIYHCLLKNLHPDTIETCLVDVTSEATEVGIVRDGILKHVTHVPYGTYTLAREIEAACKVPKEEAYSYLKDDIDSVEDRLNSTQQDQFRAVLSSYELKLSSLFKTTGDKLSIPKTVFLHTDAKTEDFFTTLIQTAATDATQNRHNIHLVTAKLMEETESADTAILVSALHYHNNSSCNIVIE